MREHLYNRPLPSLPPSRPFNLTASVRLSHSQHGFASPGHMDFFSPFLCHYVNFEKFPQPGDILLLLDGQVHFKYNNFQLRSQLPSVIFPFIILMIRLLPIYICTFSPELKTKKRKQTDRKGIAKGQEKNEHLIAILFYPCPFPILLRSHPFPILFSVFSSAFFYLSRLIETREPTITRDYHQHWKFRLNGTK